MTELVVGTAGHVDHGKTTLIKALTGVDCDTLLDERRRSMTIELGFAAWVLPSGQEVSVVDVPGHERFIRTMAVGARSVDLALLCVAADDGVMPQTREHAAVLGILGVHQVLVVVTKADLAPDRAAAVGAQALQVLAEIGIPAAGWCACSARLRLGLPQLATAAEAALRNLPEIRGRGCPRLLVDRSFSRVGTGTVVTGVLDGGALRTGDRVEVFPSSTRGRVQALQRRGQAVVAAEAGGRLAVALNGITVAQVPRGSVVGLAGEPWGTQYLDCAIQVPAQGARGVRQGMHLDVLCGTSSTTGRLWLAGDAQLVPGRSGYGQLNLDAPLWALPGDRVLLRGPSPSAILAGAVVLDAHPIRHHRWPAAPLDSWWGRERALGAAGFPDFGQLAVIEAASSPHGLDPAAAGRRAGIDAAAAREALEAAVGTGQLISVGHRYLARARWAELAEGATSQLAAHELTSPYDPGLSKQRLTSALGFPPGLDGDAALRRLAQEGRLQIQGPVVTLPGRSVRGTRPVAAERFVALLQRGGANPPGATELAEAGMTKEIRAYLIRSGEALELDGGVLISRSGLLELEDRLVELLTAAPAAGLTVAQIRDSLGSSRRVVVPLLQRWLQEGRTERHGDLHQLSRRPQCQVT